MGGELNPLQYHWQTQVERRHSCKLRVTQTLTAQCYHPSCHESHPPLLRWQLLIFFPQNAVTLLLFDLALG